MIWNWWNKKRNQNKFELQEEGDDLLKEIEQAKQEWIRAYDQLDYAVGKEQIDYAIFALEAAEKRYEMLLNQAKNMHRELKTQPIKLDASLHKGESL